MVVEVKDGEKVLQALDQVVQTQAGGGVELKRRPFGQGGSFEVGTLPSASVVNQYLTPNATVLSDDGKTLRWESRGSVLLPGDGLGVDPIMLLLAAQIFN